MPEVNPAKERLEYSPDFGKSIVNESKNLGLEVKLPSSIPTNSLVDWLVLLPSRAALKDKVGPKELAIVGDEDSGEGDGEEAGDWSGLVFEADKSSLAGDWLVLVGLRVGLGEVLVFSWALLFVDWCCEARYAPIGIESNINI